RRGLSRGSFSGEDHYRSGRKDRVGENPVTKLRADRARASGGVALFVSQRRNGSVSSLPSLSPGIEQPDITSDLCHIEDKHLVPYCKINTRRAQGLERTSRRMEMV